MDTKQAEAEVVPSSSLVEVEIEIGVWVSMQFNSAIEIFDDFCGFSSKLSDYQKILKG